MILVTHALAGTVIGENLDNPSAIIILSLASHYFLDSFRHGEYFNSRVSTMRTAGWKVALDLFSAILVVSLIGYLKHWNRETSLLISLAFFFSLLPDGITFLYWTFKWKFLDKLSGFGQFCHRYDKWEKYGPERQWTFRNEIGEMLIVLVLLIVIFWMK